MLILPVLGFLGIMLSTFLFEIIGGFLRADISSQTNKDIRTQLFQHVQVYAAAILRQAAGR